MVRLDQIYELTRVRLSARYRGTVAGILWVAISPVSLFSIQAAVFGTLIGKSVPDYPLFLLTGLLPWLFFTQCVDMGTSLFTHYGTLLKSSQIRPWILVAALIVDNFLIFMGTMVFIAVGYMLWQSHWYALSPLLLLPTLLFSIWVFGITWILAVANVFLRDTRFVVSFALQVLFFLTPILYSESTVIPVFRWVHRWNPMAALLAPFRSCFFGATPAIFWQQLGKASLITFVTAFIAYRVWRKLKNAVYFRL